MFIPIEPFSRCFSAVYRVCCPCLYKKKKKYEEEDEKGEKSEDEGDKTKKTDSDDEIHVDNKDDDDARRRPRPSTRKYGTIGQLANATVIVQPPPVFARFMLRKSVERLNTEVCLILSMKLFRIIFVCFSFELLMNFDHDWKKLKKIEMMTTRDLSVIVKIRILMNNLCEKKNVWCKLFVLTNLSSLHCVTVLYIYNIKQKKTNFFLFYFLFFQCMSVDIIIFLLFLFLYLLFFSYM